MRSFIWVSEKSPFVEQPIMSDRAWADRAISRKYGKLTAGSLALKLIMPAPAATALAAICSALRSKKNAGSLSRW